MTLMTFDQAMKEVLKGHKAWREHRTYEVEFIYRYFNDHIHRYCEVLSGAGNDKDAAFTVSDIEAADWFIEDDINVGSEF